MQIATAWVFSQNPFAAIYPNVSLNNLGQTASPTWLSNKQGGQNSLVTSPHPGQITLPGIRTPGYVASPKIADNG